MASPLVPARHLTPTVAARIRHCGAPLVYVTPDGPQSGHWSCGSSWCDWCSERRRSRARRIIADRLTHTDLDEVADDVALLGDDDDELHLVTLTVPHRHDLSAAYLRDRVETVATVWRDTSSRLRWHAYRWYRDDASAADRVPPPGRGGPHPYYASTWQDGWQSVCSAGVWVREITDGGGTGWHVHVHAVVRSREDAELLNAAWQASVVAAGEIRDGYWTRTDIRAIPASRAARYVAKYLTKQDARELPDELIPAYIEGSRGMRRADAWGGWRPLGLSRQPGDATHVADPDWDTAVEVAAYYGETPLARWLRTGRPPAHPDAWAEMCVRPLPGPLIVLLTHTDDAELLAESRLAALAVARALGRTSQLDVA